MSEQNTNPQNEDGFQAAEDAVEIDFDFVDPEDDGSPMWEGEEGDVEPDPEPEAEAANPEDDEVDAGDDEVEGDPEDDETAEVRDWDHNVDSLPEEVVVDGVRVPVKGLYQDMVRGYQKSNQRAVAAEKRAAERELQYKQLIDDIKAGNDDTRPAEPTEDMSAAEQRQRWDDIQRWLYRDEARRQRVNAAPAVAAPVATEAPPQYQLPPDVPDTPENRAGYARGMRIVQRDDYTEEIGNEMLRVSQTDPYWAQQCQTDEGIDKLFEITKERVEAAALKAQLAQQEKSSIRRAAGANNRTVKSSSGSRRVNSRADAFAKKIESGEKVTWEDAEKAS